MKPNRLLNTLLMAAQWLQLAQREVRTAIHLTGADRVKWLGYARADAARFRRYSAMWWNAIQAMNAAA